MTADGLHLTTPSPSASARENPICSLLAFHSLSLLRTLSHMENTMMEVRPPRDAKQRRTDQARRRRLQSFSLGAINPAWISPHSDSGGGEARRRMGGSVCTSGFGRDGRVHLQDFPGQRKFHATPPPTPQLQMSISERPGGVAATDRVLNSAHMDGRWRRRLWRHQRHPFSTDPPRLPDNAIQRQDRLNWPVGRGRRSESVPCSPASAS